MQKIDLRKKVWLFVNLLLPLIVFTQVKQEFPVLKGAYLGQKTPGKKPEIFAPGIISTSAGEICISFMPGAKELYFSRRIGSNRTILCMKEKTGVWTPPEAAAFSGRYDDAEFTLSPDGKKLVFISLRPFIQRSDPLKYFDIWIVERTGEKWGEPVHLDPPVNSDKMEVYPAFSGNGDLYFSSNRDSNWDIYISRYENGFYTKPEKLSSAINTEYGEWDQAIAPDDSYMVFCSRDRKDSYGGSDLYISFRNKNGTWTKAKNMGKDINSGGGMICPSISPDGKFIFFNTTLNGKNGIYWVSAKIIEDLKPEELR